MASLTPKLGTTSPTSLVKSAATLQNEIATYNDTIQKITYENSGHTDAAFSTYQDYLNSRINTLKSNGTIVDATKAANMEQTLVSAQHSNISYHIQQENIALMAQGDSGTAAGYQAKMNVLADQFSRAMSIGDATLADTLESQYYSASQSYQNAVQTANNAAVTAAKASNAANVTNEKDIIGALHSSLDQLNSNVKTLGPNAMNSTIKDWVTQNKGTLEALGVKLPDGATPNYWNIVNGVMGALYNANTTLSQLYTSTNPYDSVHYQTLAQNLMDGTTKISTLGGSLTAAEVQQAETDPNMFATNFTTGAMTKTQQTGYQITKGGLFNGAVEPTYGGHTEKTTFLSPYQVGVMNAMHLEFAQTNSSGKANQAQSVDQQLGINNKQTGQSKGTMTAANGVTVQVTDQTPQWLRNVIGTGNTVQMYLDQQVPGQFLEFGHPGDPGGYYVVGIDGRGLTGGFRIAADEKNPGGISVQAIGGQYGFSQNAVWSTINNALNNRFQVQQAHQDTLKMQSAPVSTPRLTAATSPTVQPIIAKTSPVPTTKSVGQSTVTTPALQHAAGAPAVQNAGGGGHGGFGGGMGALGLQ